MKYARKCSITGRGMNRGWVFNDGEFYVKDDVLAHKHAVKLGYKDLIDSYNAKVSYWTTWENLPEEEYIYDKDGKEL